MKRLRVLYEASLVGELLAQDGIHYFSYDAQNSGSALTGQIEDHNRRN